MRRGGGEALVGGGLRPGAPRGRGFRGQQQTMRVPTPAQQRRVARTQPRCHEGHFHEVSPAVHRNSGGRLGPPRRRRASAAASLVARRAAAAAGGDRRRVAGRERDAAGGGPPCDVRKFRTRRGSAASVHPAVRRVADPRLVVGEVLRRVAVRGDRDVERGREAIISQVLERPEGVDVGERRHEQQGRGAPPAP